MRPALLFRIIWLGWLISWMLPALWSDRPAKRLLTWDVLVYPILILAGVILSLRLTARHVGVRRIRHVGYTGAYLLAGETLARILFAWWARIHLGRLWSSAVTRKEHHRVVDSGPYSLFVIQSTRDFRSLLLRLRSPRPQQPRSGAGY